jgi:hypothetical protein
MRRHVAKDLAEQRAESRGGGGGKADSGLAGGPDCDVDGRVEEIGYVVKTVDERNTDDCCSRAASIELACDASNTLKVEEAYIAQKARTTATVIFFFLFICNLCTMKIGTILNVQSVAQDNAE